MHAWTPEIDLTSNVDLPPEFAKALLDAQDAALAASRGVAQAAELHRNVTEHYRILLLRTGLTPARLARLGFAPASGVLWRPVPALAPLPRPGVG